MSDIKNPKAAIPIVLIAGILWSFGPFVVRHIDQPQLVPWQYLITRGVVIFLLLNVYLFYLQHNQLGLLMHEQTHQYHKKK